MAENKLLLDVPQTPNADKIQECSLNLITVQQRLKTQGKDTVLGQRVRCLFSLER